MSKFFESDAERTRLFPVEEKCANFGFGGTGHDWFHDLGKDMNGAVVRWGRIRGSRGRGWEVAKKRESGLWGLLNTRRRYIPLPTMPCHSRGIG